MENKSCCFIGHRKIPDTQELRNNLQEILIDLIENGTVIFNFGDHSAFNNVCYETVTKLKETYPQIKRVRFRTDYENADKYTMNFLLVGFEGSICPKGVGKAGKASYVLRNQAMIQKSDVCIFYYDEKYSPADTKDKQNHLNGHSSKSGTAIAYQYAVKIGKRIYNLCQK